MKLFGSYTSPFVRHCRIVVEQLGSECEFVEVDNVMSAEQSPSMKVPFLKDGELELTDSTSILFHLYNKSGKPFITSAEEMNTYAMTNTTLDSTINVFLLEADGVTPETSKYLARQTSRIEKSLDTFESSNVLIANENNIASTRLFCFLDWCLFRGRASLAERPNLQAFVDQMNNFPAIKNTAPPS